MRAPPDTLASVRARAIALCALLFACGSKPPPPPAAVVAHAEPIDAGPSEPEPEPAPPVDAPERTRPPSSATYDEAMATPEALDVNDDRVQLTDAQLTGPIRGALGGCRIPPNAKITVRTAVQNGRAIGVTVDVRLVKPPPPKTKKKPRPPSKAAQQAEAKVIAKVTACVEKNVRATVWPPSRRRDSFTTEF